MINKINCEESTKKILGVVILYNPNFQDLVANINQYLGSISNLIIWQNSVISENETREILSGVVEPEKISFLGNGKNVGIGVALNEVVHFAECSDFRYLLTMDQDSYFVDFDIFLREIYEIGNESTKIFGPITINVVTNEPAVVSSEFRYLSCDFVITSGAIYDLNLFAKVGYFKEDYFIDAIDEEICYRAYKKGFNTVKVSAGKLYQHFGDYKKVKFYCLELSSSNYSATRYFYIVRNHIWLAKSGLVKGKARFLMIYNYVVSPVLKVSLIEKNKIEKLTSIFKGIFEGVFQESSEEGK